MILNKQFFERALSPGFCFFEDGTTGVSSYSYLHFLDENRDCTLSIDSRTIKSGEIFLALEGPNFDGHDFISEALSRGASALIIQKDKKNFLNRVSSNLLRDRPIIIVENTYPALIEMAKYWRQGFEGKVIGITGSLGKTTTKEILGSILRSSGIPAYVSFKNQNNIIGLCINILKKKKSDRVAVFEVGINHKGEMDELTDILRPDIAVITSIAHVHTEGLMSLGKIAAEKQRIMKHFSSSNIGVIPGDCNILTNSYYNHPIIRFGLKKKNQIQAKGIKMVLDEGRFGTTGISFILRIFKEEFKLFLGFDNEIVVKNALAAVATATLISLPVEKIIAGLENFKSISGRFEKRVLKNNKGILINDCYNASPESMKKALKAFHKMRVKGSKIAVLGDMLELGKKEIFWHRQIGKFLCNTLSIKHLILVGNSAHVIATTAPLTMKVSLAQDWKEAYKRLNEVLERDSLVLLKSSRAVGLTNIVDKIA